MRWQALHRLPALLLGWLVWSFAGLAAAATGSAAATANAPAGTVAAPALRAANATAAPTLPDAPVILRHVQVLRSDALEEPPSGAAWEAIDLPHRMPNPAVGLPTYWYAATFSLASPG